MSAKCDAAENTITGSDVEAMPAGPCQSPGSLVLERASTFVRGSYGNTVDDVVLIIACSLASDVVEDEEEWNLGDIQLLRNADLGASLRVDFMVNQM